MKKSENATLKSTHYICDKPCKHGHVGLRYSSNHGCVECTKTERRKHIRQQWRAANIDHVRQQDKEYAKKNAEKISQYHKQHYLNVERIRHQTPEFKAKRSVWMKRRYNLSKERHLQQTFEYFKTLNLPPLPKVFTESTFELYTMWMLTKHLNTPIDNQYTLPNTKFKIDLFIPEYQVGIEVKIEALNWTQKRIKDQVAKYEQVLGKGNVYVVSPMGKYQYNLPNLMSVLRNRIETLQEHLAVQPS